MANKELYRKRQALERGRLGKYSDYCSLVKDLELIEYMEKVGQTPGAYKLFELFRVRVLQFGRRVA